MNIQLYIRENCANCTEVKRWLSQRAIDFNTITIDQTITRDQVLEMFPEAKLLPLVVFNQQYIGSAKELYNQMDTIENKSAAIKNILNNAVAMIEFTKVNGEKRVLRATRDPNKIDSKFHPNGTKSKQDNNQVIACFDLDINQWRSFRTESVTNYYVGK